MAVDRFEIIGELKDNWNGYGAKAFTKGHIEVARIVYSHLKDGFEIFPTAAGSIQLEYEDDNEYIEFEVFENGMIKMYREGYK